MWRVIGGDDICSESSVRVRSALGAGKGRNYVLLVCVDLNLVLKLDNITLRDLINKSMVKELRWRHCRNFLLCVEDGGRGV